MRTGRREGAALAVTLAAVALAGCAAQSPRPQLAQLTAHVNGDTILPVTTGHGDRTLAGVKLGREGVGLGIEASCAGRGTVTVSVPRGGALVADCSRSGAQLTSAVFPKAPVVSGQVRVTTSVPGTDWNATIFYTTSG